MLKARLHYYAIVGREIPFQLHNTRGPRPSWRSAFDVLTNRSVVTTRRDILLLLLNCKFLTFTETATRFTSFDGSLAPKVVQIIESYNNLRAFFVIFRVFGEFLCDFRVRRLAVRRRRRAARAFGELQSAAVGRRRTARRRNACFMKSASIFGPRPAERPRE